jgi:flagellar biosynthesis/type III secretory pathway protein FliH
MLEIPPFTIEELKDLPFTAKAVEQLEQEATLKGKKEGLQEGVTKAKRDYVKSAILMKFEVLPKELEEKIESTDDIEALDEMFKKVILSSKIEEIL